MRTKKKKRKDEIRTLKSFPHSKTKCENSVEKDLPAKKRKKCAGNLAEWEKNGNFAVLFSANIFINT